MRSSSHYFANCICIGCQDRRKEWREKSTLTDHDDAPTPSQQATPEAPNPAQSASATGGGALGVERLSGPEKTTPTPPTQKSRSPDLLIF